MSDNLVKGAHAMYNAGNFAEAKVAYENLNNIFGKKLFDYNIRLCAKKNVDLASSDSNRQTNISDNVIKDPELAQQLAETQRLLEHYFQRSQNLELQLARLQPK